MKDLDQIRADVDRIFGSYDTIDALLKNIEFYRSVLQNIQYHAMCVENSHDVNDLREAIQNISKSTSQALE